ncbi:MAG TPA: HipA family kinase [Rhodocyclaceae bacterium]|nr:HipA family kinase [Rhodocyclaceae bacterium]
MHELAFRQGTLGRPMEPPISACSNPVLLGPISTGLLPFFKGYVKLLPDSSFAIESVCAWLAFDRKLPIPEPMFVRVARANLPLRCPWPYEHPERTIAFCSVQVPSALPLARTADTGLLRGWPDLLAVAMFDLLIANEDRSNENILITPRKKFFIIDHERALGAAGAQLFSRHYFPIVRNPLLDLLVKDFSYKELAAMRSSIITIAADFATAIDRIPYDALLVSKEMATQIDAFLQARSSKLVEWVFEHLNIRELPELKAPPNDLRAHDRGL